MVLEGKHEAEVPLQSDGDEIFHMLVGNKHHHAPTLASHVVHDLKLHEGSTGKHGSSKIWTFTADGKVEQVKEKVTHFDEKNRIVELTAIEGDHLSTEYSDSVMTFKFLKKEDGKNSVKIIHNYKKKDADTHEPHKYIYFFIGLITAVDAKLPKAE